MSEFDTGSNYKDADELEFERMLNLTDAEKKIYKEIIADLAVARTEFTVAMKEHEAIPKMSPIKLEATIGKDVKAMWLWLKIIIIKGNMATPGTVAAMIIEEGIKATMQHYNEKELGAMLRREAVASAGLPEIMVRKIFVEQMRYQIERRKKIEEEKFKQSMGG